ncbi:ABC transporter substrate-binding protein [Catenuloplanes japonicus]|uniref:ABC transporter substrate-binding protein n=1 Tax=Catenuloplanes japonicus TaxID=33876 RepID=UPI0007C445EE|nr:ABC transporter substrate-binding protein [Catenuloplanes japonicus]
MSNAWSRRGFLTLSAATGVTALVGCGAGEQPEASASPVRGGRLRALFPGGGEKETLDPHVPPLFLDQARHKAIFDKLTELGHDMQPVPRLAESWEPNADATVWRFTLRDASFHDGRKLTPDDVLFSLARIMDPADTTRPAKSLLANLDLANSRAAGANVVELAVKVPTAELPVLLAGTGNAIVPAGYGDPAKAVGTGPFSLVSFERGRSMVARRFDGFWGGPAHLDELHLISAGDETARGNALAAGEAEYAHDMSAVYARTNENNPAVRIVAAEGAVAQSFAMRTNAAPFDNPDARLALRLLADRQRLIDVAFSGRAVLGNDLFGKGFRYFADDLPQRTRDVDQAKSLLARAGLTGATIPLHTSEAAAGMVTAATLLAEQAKEAGLTLEVRPRAKETYFADILNGGPGLWSYRAGSMPVTQDLALRMVSSAKQNITAWNDPAFDAACTTAQSTTDDTARTGLYHDVQAILHDRGGLLVWGHSDWLIATAQRLHGVEAARPNTVDWARFDQVWLA